jgi:hypothetical protein
MREFNALKPIGSLYEKNFKEKMGVGKGVEPPIGGSTPQTPLVKII